MQLIRPATILMFLTAATGLHAQAPADGTLIPQPFLVEHQLIQTDSDGSAFAGDPVTDYYGGTWIVSVRPDGSRLVIDLARRELTGVRPEDATYWTVSFSRLAELQEALARAEGTIPNIAAEPEPKRNAGPPEFTVTESTARSRRDDTRIPEAKALQARSGVRHLRVELKDATPETPALEVWVDPQIALGPAAIAALLRFEEDVLGARTVPGKAREVPPSRYLAAARQHAGGAFPIRTLRALAGPEGTPQGTIEDLATRLEPLDSFPLELVRIAEGLRQITHPLEAVVAFAEQEAAVRDAMAGEPDAGKRAAEALKADQ
ncbi:MAG: hypothetical protein GY856_40760 [bacterium]|nr:hypothetical protein [bacterium]